ncbi:SanA/YdcF family protein [Marinospirillum sp.]|uniref:SanA/YdcF family protein n=1 Tax=Marinospirillum sp. TaxID=2183934 RepID=UPI003A848AA0
MRWLMRWFSRLALMALFCALLLLLLNSWFVLRQQSKIEQQVELCADDFSVAIVFGTSQFLRSGAPNPHFFGRVERAAALYHAGHVEHLLLSGDNRTFHYNEPLRMQQNLQELAVPVSRTTLDFAGLSTFDTLKRARDVFQVERALLVTQDYHLPRALYIAQSLGLEAAGCVAPGPDWQDMKRLWLREVAARMRTLGDLHLWQRAPRILGDPEPLDF